MNIPVYLFNGFLGCGKTKFIQETLQDERFGKDEKTLLIVCEEGEEGYDEDKFEVKECKIVYFEEEEELTQEKFTELTNSFKPDNIIIEYNGMWTNDALFSAFPESWVLNQIMTFFDARTFLSYNRNMRQLVFEKISITDLVVFNRFNSTMDKELFHKTVRGITRQTDILYESVNGVVERDDIEDPLPYDINAEIIAIDDKDYAYFYRDLAEDGKKYDGKIVRFTGLVGISKKMPTNNCLIGRYVMTCCEADIKYTPLVLETQKTLADKAYYVVTAKIVFEKNKMYKGYGPVLKAQEISDGQEPTDSVATFY